MSGSPTDRIQAAWNDVVKLKNISGVPAISLGLAHDGKDVRTDSVGLRDVHNNLPASSATVYLLGSCSKIFLPAAIGILVHEEKLSWDDRLAKHIPDFNPEGDPRISTEATIRDALCHIVGLSRPDVLLLGPRCTILGTQSEFVSFLNKARAENQYGLKFRRWWKYDNFAFGLVALVVEAVTGKTYADFVRARILDPLGMRNTVVSQSDLKKNPDVSLGYAMLDNGDFVKLESHNYTADSHSPVLAAFGMQSSVDDMLKFSRAMMIAWRDGDASFIEPGHIENPLKQMQTVLSAQWTRPTADGFDNELAYCMGCYSGYLPTAGVGYLGLNQKTAAADPDYDEKYILGRGSEKRIFFIGFNGNMNGYSSAMYLFPETQSAVIALTNGMNLGDAADTAAKMMMQALLDLRPHVDMVALAEREAELHRRWFDDMMSRWHEHRRPEEAKGPIEDYVGRYKGHNTVVIDITMPTGLEGPPLVVTFGGVAESACELELFAKDQLSFLPKTRDDWLKNGMFDWDDWYVGILRFNRDKEGNIAGFDWEYEPDDVAQFVLQTEQDYTRTTALVNKDAASSAASTSWFFNPFRWLRR